MFRASIKLHKLERNLVGTRADRRVFPQLFQVLPNFSFTSTVFSFSNYIMSSTSTHRNREKIVKLFYSQSTSHSELTEQAGAVGV